RGARLPGGGRGVPRRGTGRHGADGAQVRGARARHRGDHAPPLPRGGRGVSPFGKLALTIGALWLAAVAVAPVVYPTTPRRGREITGETFAQYHTTAYVGQLVTITVLALVALVVAGIWAGRKHT